MSNINYKIDQNIARDEFNQVMDKIECWTGFWQLGKVIIPLWMSKNGNERMTMDEMKGLGAPIPSANDELIYKEWCAKEGVKYLSPR